MYDWEFDFAAVSCKCGKMPEIFARFPVGRHQYQGFVECPNCGEIHFGPMNYVEEDAIADAIAEWNKIMTKEELEKKLDEDLEAGKITVEEAEDEWQEFTHKGEDRRGW